MADPEVAGQAGDRRAGLLLELRQLLDDHNQPAPLAPDVVPVPQPQVQRLIMIEQVSEH